MTTFNLFKFSAQYCCSVSTFVFINNFALLINQSRTHEFHCARKADIVYAPRSCQFEFGAIQKVIPKRN